MNPALYLSLSYLAGGMIFRWWDVSSLLAGGLLHRADCHAGQFQGGAGGAQGVAGGLFSGAQLAGGIGLCQAIHQHQSHQFARLRVGAVAQQAGEGVKAGGGSSQH